MTKFAIFCTGMLLCGTLLTGCGSQQQSSVIPEDSPVQHNTQYQAGSTAPPAVRERPHLASKFADGFFDFTKN